MKVMPLIAASGAVAALLAGVAVLAQNGAPPAKSAAPSAGTAHLWSEVGSFSLEGTGTVKVKFTGTLLVASADGQDLPKISIQGDVRKEFDNTDMGRIAWFGKGDATITGNWRRLVVFGKQIDATWQGAGIAMVYGEFDSAGKTGFITVDGSEPFEWLATGQTFYVPAAADPRIQRGSGEVNPRLEPSDGGGAQPEPAPKLGG